MLSLDANAAFLTSGFYT